MASAQGKIIPPNFTKWFLHDVLLVEEALCLMAGIDPHSDLANDMLKVLRRAEPAAVFHSKYDSYKEIMDLMGVFLELNYRLERSVSVGKLYNRIQYYKNHKALPLKVFADYALNDPDCCPACKQALAPYLEKQAETQKSRTVSKNQNVSIQSRTQKTLLTKERETALKLIIGLAIDGYGFDPKASKSPIPEQITDVLAGLGIPLDSDTVRKWLREGAEILPREGLDERKTNSS